MQSVERLGGQPPVKSFALLSSNSKRPCGGTRGTRTNTIQYLRWNRTIQRTIWRNSDKKVRPKWQKHTNVREDNNWNNWKLNCPLMDPCRSALCRQEAAAERVKNPQKCHNGRKICTVLARKRRIAQGCVSGWLTARNDSQERSQTEYITEWTVLGPLLPSRSRPRSQSSLVQCCAFSWQVNVEIGENRVSCNASNRRGYKVTKMVEIKQ